MEVFLTFYCLLRRDTFIVNFILKLIPKFEYTLQVTPYHKKPQK